MIFGEPSTTGTWSWRYEGHHISHSWTVINGELNSTTPQFFGATLDTFEKDIALVNECSVGKNIWHEAFSGLFQETI
ncbi:MAG: hypothetical protein CM1200mP25_1390 [Acidobacteriota bacterium]|nr:MAG: hypothetical protein CM1200mP25_1390 [Acidobacteriota bacterium]